MNKVGVFLSRMQPIHNAHLWMIGNALKENEQVLVIVGSANKVGHIRNPLDIKLRIELVEKAVEEKFGKDYRNKIKIIELPDWSTEKNNDDQEWGRLIYYNVVANMNIKEFSFYCSEEPSKICGWFEDKLKSRINFRFFSRDNEFNYLSATKVREAIINDDIDYIEKYCPRIVLEKREEIKEKIKMAKSLE